MKKISSLFFIYFILSIKLVTAQFTEEKNYILYQEIAGSNDIVILGDDGFNYYDFNTKSAIPESNKFITSGLPRMGNHSADALSTITLLSPNGKIAVQYEQKKIIDEIVIINTSLKTSKLVKLSAKIEIDQSIQITEDGGCLFNNNFILNTTTGKITKFNAKENGYIQHYEMSKGIALFVNYNGNKRGFTLKNIATGSIVKKWTAQISSFNIAGKWLITETEINNGQQIEALNTVSGATIKLPLNLIRIDVFKNLSAGKCFFDIINIKKEHEQFIWDIDANKLYPISLKRKAEMSNYLVCLGGNNTIYYYLSTGVMTLQKIDYKQNKILNEWSWGDEYVNNNKTRLRLSNTSYTQKTEEVKLKPLFSKYANYTNKEMEIANCIKPMQELRPNYFKLPFTTKHDIPEIKIKYFDVNRDGYKDAIYQDTKTKTVTILLNDKQNNFTNSIQLPAFTEDFTNSNSYFKDVNGDGKVELILTEEDYQKSISKIYIFDFTIVANSIKYYDVKKEHLLSFTNFFKLNQKEETSLAENKKADFNKDGEPDYATIVYRFKGISINTLPELSEATLNKMKLKSISGDLYSGRLTIVFPSAPNFTLEGDFDKDGKDDFLVSTNSDGTYIFFNNNNGKDFEIKRINTVFRSAEMFNVNNSAIYIGRSYKDLIALSFDAKRTIISEPLFKNIAESYFDYDAFEDLDNDGLKEFIDFASVYNMKEKIIDEVNITVYKPYLTKDNIHYTGLSIDMDKEQADKDAEWVRKMKEKEAEKRKKEETGKVGSTTKKEEPKTEPVDYSKLSKGLGVFSGISSSGLRIEVEATVWYKNVQTKGMLGFKYKEVYKAECIRFRYPTNSKTWYSLSGSECIYKCENKSMTFSKCISIQGMVFALAEPTIY